MKLAVRDYVAISLGVLTCVHAYFAGQAGDYYIVGGYFAVWGIYAVFLTLFGE